MKAQRNLLICGAVFCLLSNGCIETSIKKLPAFELASSLSRPDRAKLFCDESMDRNALPSISPFAIVSASASSEVSEEWERRRIWDEANALGADLVIVFDRGSQVTGAVSNYLGFGVTLTQPTRATLMDGVCYKLNPARIGFLTNEVDMVVRIDSGSNLRDAGLLEGDTILSVGDTPWASGSSWVFSSRYVKLLSLRPGDEVHLVWLRPGTGRMEGLARCIDNSPTHLQLQDCLPWVQAQPQQLSNYERMNPRR